MEESRVVNGTACCHAEIEVYDKKTPLLVVVDTREGNNLSLSISQLGISSDGPRFIPVNVCLQFDAATDSAIRVTLLDKLPIVVVATQKKSLYFFELHSGTHLYTHHDLDFMLSTSVDGQSILNQLAYRTLERISINEKDLIRWVRKVLNNHALASSISIRTGLPDTDVVTIDNMRTLR
ncbi:hypothetical protein FRC02_003177 [Tulasnella sp. 418]|nr:hypothetical protein FRC02_003177 [Tulasnella sp. 418]